METKGIVLATTDLDLANHSVLSDQAFFRGCMLGGHFNDFLIVAFS
jgi:hypothetical protein